MLFWKSRPKCPPPATRPHHRSFDKHWVIFIHCKRKNVKRLSQSPFDATTNRGGKDFFSITPNLYSKPESNDYREGVWSYRQEVTIWNKIFDAAGMGFVMSQSYNIKFMRIQDRYLKTDINISNNDLSIAAISINIAICDC